MTIGLDPARPAPKGHPEIRLKGKGFNIGVPLGDGPVLPSAGGPNIEELERPEKPSLTRDNGQILKRLDVPAFWDGWPRQNVQPDVMEVVNLSLDTPLADFTAEGPMPFSGARFVMDWPDWVNITRSDSGVMVRVELMLHLVEFNDTRRLRAHKKRKGKGHSSGGTTAPATITLKRPETLVEVAARYEGDPARAKAIGKANGIHDIKKKLPKGTRLKLPGDSVA